METNIQDLFDQSEFFKGISPKSKGLLREISIPKTLSKKQRLFNEGDTGHSLFLLASGAVGLYKTTPGGREIVIKVIRPGEIFGEVVLFEQEHYPVAAVSMTAGLVLLLPRRQFYQLLEHREFRNDFISMLMKKQRYLADRIKYLTMYDVEERFFFFMREHYTEGTGTVPQLSRKDMAAAIGTTPETYSRLLARLSSEGKIELDGKIIRIKG